MTLNQLRYFCELAQTEHYGAVAKRLYISQPSLSRAIALLQEELGVELFEKQGRNVALTQAGRDFFQYAQRALEQVRLGTEAMKPYANHRQKISIGCVIPASSTCVAPMVEEFVRCTGITAQFAIDTGQTEELVDRLIQGQYDVIFGSRPSGVKGVQFVPVMEMPFMVIVRKQDPLAAQKEITPEQLREANRPILLTSARAYSALILQMLEYYGINRTVVGVANEDNGLLGMVQAGLGVFIGTDYPQMHTGDVALVPFRQKRFHRYIYMAYSTARTYSPAAREMIRFNCRKALTEENAQADLPGDAE